MPRSTSFRQVDVSRAIKGARAAGMMVARVEIDSEGRIVIIAADGNQQQDEFERWEAKHHAGKSS